MPEIRMRNPINTNLKSIKKTGQIAHATATMLGAEDETDAAEVPHDSATSRKLGG